MSRADQKGMVSMATDGHLNFDTKIDESGFNKGVKSLGNLGKKALTVVGGALAGIASAVGAGVAAPVKVGASFEAEMSKVSAISGATGEELGLLGEKAKEMGEKTKFSASESAQAMEYMAMAGWKTEDMLSGIEGVMNLAAASGEDLATTSDIVTDALTAFGLSAQDSTHFADVLAAASSNANTNVGLMGETFKYVAPVAGALGFNAEDCATAIGLMANSGIKASQAGTSLRSIISRMAKPTDEVQTAMDKLGISIANSDGSMKSLNEITMDLRKGFAGLSEAEQAQMASAIGGQEAMSGLLAIVNASDDDFNKLKDSIYNCDGAAADMAETMQNNLQGQLTILKSSAEGLGIKIYESLQKPLTNFVKAAVALMGDLNEAYSDGGFVGFINEIGAKVPILQGFTDAIAELAKKLQGMSTEELKNLGKIALSIGGAIPAFVAIGKGASAFSGVLSGFGEISGGAIEKLGKLPASVKNAGSAVSKLGGSFKGLGSAITGPFQVLAPKLTGIVGKTFSFLPTKISGIVGKIGPAIAGKFPAITSAFSDFGGYIGAWGGQVGSALNKVLGNVAGFIPSFGRLIGFGAVIAVVTAGLGILYSKFGDQIDEILLMVQTKGPEIITKLGEKITEKLPTLIEQGALMMAGLMSAITANLPALLSVGIGIISSLISGIAEQLPMLIPMAVDMILTLVMGLLENLPQLIDSGLKLLEGLVQGLVNALPKIADAVPKIITSLVTTIIKKAPQILQTGVQLIVQLGVGLVKAIPQLLKHIPQIISAIAGAFKEVKWGEVGLNIIKGIASGIKEAISVLIDAAAEAAESALNWVKEKLGIHSPSTVFRDQVGKMMALGIGVGFENNIPLKSMNAGLQKAVSSLKKDVIFTTSARSGKTVGEIKNNPEFGSSGGTDWDEWERRQRRINKERDSRPIFLNTDRIDRPLPKGAVPAL